jgi:L-malate glycosyltransferase
MRVLNLPAVIRPAADRRPVSVCFVIDRLSRAGTETQLLALIRHLDRDRVRPSLCLLNGGTSDTRELMPSGCPALDLRLGRLASPAALIAAGRLAAFWRRNRVDVVQTYFLDSTYFAVPLARLCGIRHVVRVRNNVGYWLTGRHRWLGRHVGRLAGVTLTNSEDARDALIAAERLAPPRVRVFENGVDLDRFPALRRPDTSAAVVRVGAVANLRPVKNIDGLIEAADEVCRADPRVRFEVAGDGPERARLEQQIRVAGLSERFVLRGPVADVPRFLSGLDVAVLPSHSESMSNALLEYMAAGRAIVATDVGANSRLIRPDREGLVVSPSDSAALAGAICGLLHDPELARSLGAAARLRAESEFGRAAMVRRFEAFYESLFNEPARGRTAGRVRSSLQDS